ncbi:MAG: hypothetical protein KBH21_05980 [Acetoanaerobium sp.]|jgi:hypothetical protein|nr:hypothetical protein [Candidatus Syntrophosphaera sp.]MBP8763402.1 hypothetical protein [Acetoanaerobium sp.]
MAINYRKCPECNSRNVIKILYGEPTGEALFMEAQGKIKLGGCLITDIDPEYYCNDCANEWNKKEVVDKAYGDIEGIKTSVGGYFGGYYEIDIDFTSRKLEWSFQVGVGENTYYSKTIRKATLERFVEGLKVVNLLNWKNNYIDLDILDGTQWNIEIKQGAKIREISGDNKFPKEWDNFCNLMKWVSEKNFR